MEPIRHTLTARLGILRMYREDVDQLVVMFQRSCERVTISDRDNRYETVEEMKNHLGAKLKYLDIRGENPAVRFLFNQTEAVKGSVEQAQTTFNELRTEEITDAADALFYKMQNLLEKFRRPTARKDFIAGAIVSVAGMFWFLFHNAVTDEQGRFVHVDAPVRAAICFVAMMLFVSRGANTNFMTLEMKRNAASFWIRNREDFAKHGVMTIISNVLALIIGYLLGHYLK
jgi:hypothetical protein